MNFKESLSYDDILLIPDYADFLPNETNIQTRLAGDINLNIPVLSAAMDTVTEKDMAIALALEGGVGVIHRNLSPEVQAEHVSKVKRFLNWVIEDPVVVKKDFSIKDVKNLINKFNYSGFPVIDDNGKLCGIITDRDMRFCRDETISVSDLMTSDPITVDKTVTHKSAEEKFNKHKIEKLPVTDGTGKVAGLITVTDIEKHKNFPNAATDKNGRLIVGAAISPNDFEDRLKHLIESKVDFVVLDTAHGDSKGVLNTIETIKKKYKIIVIGGNVATEDGTRRIIEAGADAVKVGVGPGSICTTRIIAGIGVAQFTAVLECAQAAAKHDIPVIADGGIKFSGDITKALCAGASSVMLGNMLAGLKESPGKEIIYDGRMFKSYRGMGSIGAIKDGSGDRYQMQQNDVPVPEGIEGRVPYKGELKAYLTQLIIGLRKGMGYCGCKTIDELRAYDKYVKITPAGLNESHTHDISITQEAPNYSRR